MIMSDWEGPWVIADHAYEVTRRGISNGDRLFAGISEYDDYLAYIRKKEGYQPGDTLALITPFLIAYNIDDRFLVDVAKDNANFIKGSMEAIQMLNHLGYPLGIISTSYCQYVLYTTKLAGIPSENVRCTCFHINEYSRKVKKLDKAFAKAKVRDIITLPKLGISALSKETDIPLEALKTVKELDKFFWEELPKTTFKEVLEAVKPLGGYRKLATVNEILEKEGKDLCESVTIGDSITDWIMLKETREAGGLAVSFNGNDYAVRNANVAVMSNTCMITPIIVDLFYRSGLDGVEKVTRDWSYETLKNASQRNQIDASLFKLFLNSIEGALESSSQAVWVRDENLEATIKKSKEVRKFIRGEAVGSLG